MPNPEWLFYDSPKPISIFTSTVTDVFKIERMTQGLPAFQTQISEGKKNKTLVLEDFTAEQWSEQKKDIVKKKLQSLIAQGFDIYIYQEAKPPKTPLLQLSLYNIDNILDSPQLDIPLVTDRMVNDLMKAQKNIPATQIAHIDTARLKELIEDNVPGLTISELEHSKYDWTTLKAYIETKKPIIFNDLYAEDKSPKYLEILSTLKQSVPVIDKFNEIRYDQGKEERLLKYPTPEDATTVKKLYVYDSPYLQENSVSLLDNSFISGMHNLEVFDLHDIEIPSNNLISILKNNKNLKKAKLSPLFFEEEHSPRTQLNLSQLETLSLSSLGDKELFISILESSPNLKNLEISVNPSRAKIDILLTKTDISKCEFQHLEHLSFARDSDISVDIFSCFLEKVPHLKILTIMYPSKFLDLLKPENIPEDSLAHLEKLNLEISTLDPNTFKKLLETSINLKELSLKIDNENFKIDTIPEKVLKNLKTISLDCSHTYLSAISNILKNTSNLESLTLTINQGNSLLLLPEHLPIEMLTNLKELNVSQNITSDLRLYILKHAKNLNDASRKNLEVEPSETYALNTNLSHKTYTAPAIDKDITPEKYLLNNTLSPKTRTSVTADANTSYDKETTFKVKKIFKGIGCPDPSDHLYRLEVFNHVKIQNVPGNPFELSNPPDTELSTCESPILPFNQAAIKNLPKGFNYYKGKTTILLNQSWIPLPSLSPNETLTHLSITTSKGKLKTDSFEIKYSKRDNLYYIRSKKIPPEKYIEADIEFVLAQKEKPTLLKKMFTSLLAKSSIDTKAKTPTEVTRLVQKYNAYGIGTLTLPENPTGKEYLEALQTQSFGACRHRAIAFKKELEKKYPVRIIYNDSHAFVEVQETPGFWTTYDLGGYPAETLLLDEHDKPILENEATEVEADETTTMDMPTESAQPKVTMHFAQTTLPEQTAIPTNDNTIVASITKKETEVLAVVPEIISKQDLEGNPFKKIWEAHAKTTTQKELKPYILDIAQGTVPLTDEPFTEEPLKKILVKLDSSESTEAFRLLLQQQMLSLHKQVYYIDSPEDLICSAPWIERNLETNIGILKKPTEGPGGPLAQFLNAKHSNPVLVVNWSNFKAQDVVKFNSILDQKRQIDGLDVPENTLIVGLYQTNKPEAYTGEDFFSRFDAVVHMPFTASQLILAAQNLQESKKLTPLEPKKDSQNRL